MSATILLAKSQGENKMEVSQIAVRTVVLWSLFPVLAIPIGLLFRHKGSNWFSSRVYIWFFIIPVFLCSAYVDAFYFLALMVMSGMVAIFELTTLERRGTFLPVIYLLTLVLAVPWLFWAQFDLTYPWVLGSSFVLLSGLLVLISIGYNTPLQLPALAILLGASLSFWILLRTLPNGFRFVLFAFSVVVLNDMMASLGGKLLGRRHPFPRLSPHKTMAGFIFGTIGGVLAAYLFWFALYEFTFFEITIAGILLSITAPAGDLFASFIKRYYGVKDFGTLFGRMGGMLDRMDSLLLSGWVFFMYLQIST